MNLVLVFLLLTCWACFTPFSSVSIDNFEQVNASWAITKKYTSIYDASFCSLLDLRDVIYQNEENNKQLHFRVAYLI